MNKEPYTKRAAQMTIVVCLGALLLAAIVGCSLLAMRPELIMPAIGVVAGFVLLALVLALVTTRQK